MAGQHSGHGGGSGGGGGRMPAPKMPAAKMPSGGASRMPKPSAPAVSSLSKWADSLSGKICKSMQRGGSCDGKG